MNATQLVIGVSRRGRLSAAFTGPGIGATVIRESGDIDVHIVTHAATGNRFELPRLRGGALSLARRLLGFAVAVVGGPLLSWLLFAVVLSGVTLDFLFVQPLFTVTIADPEHAFALLLYVVIAILVSWIVDQAARRTRLARRATAESELLATVAGSVVRGESAVTALAGRTREVFRLAGVRLVARDGTVIATDGEPAPVLRRSTSSSAIRSRGPPWSFTASPAAAWTRRNGG